jgi:O-antigen/teichoic acid export membrane protein
MESTLKKSTFLKNFWQVSFFQLINSGSAFLVNVLVARWVGPEAFGNFYYYLSISIVATILFDFGLTRTLLRYSSHHQALGETHAKKQYYLAVLKLKTILGVVILGLSFPVVLWWGGDLRWPLLLGLITGLAVSYSQLFSAVAQTESDYRDYNLVLSFNTFRLLLVALAAGVGILTLGSLYFIFMAAPLLLIVLPGLRLGKSLAQSDQPTEPHFYANLIRFGKWMIVLAVLETLYQRLDVVMVRSLTSPVAAGYYSAGLAFFGLVYMLPTYSAALIYPQMVESESRGDQAALAGQFQFSTDLMAVIAIPLALGLWAVSPDVVRLFLGERFALAQPLFKYFAVSTMIWSCHLNTGAVLMAKDKPQWITGTVGIVLVAGVVGNWLLIPRFGIAGAGMALCFSMAVSLVLYWSILKIKFNLFPNLKHIAIYLVAGMGMAGCVRLLPTGHWAWLAGKVIAGAGIYLGGMLVLGNIFSPKLVRSLLMKKKTGVSGISEPGW